MKKIFAFVLMAVLVLSLSAAAFAAPAYNVGVCQLVQHPALDAATEGFMDALKEKLGEDAVKFSVQNASGDSATCAVICNQFVSDEVGHPGPAGSSVLHQQDPHPRHLCHRLRQRP